MINLFVFMASDNNLDVDSQNEIRDIFSAKPSVDFRLLIETDRYKTYRSSEKENRRTKRIVKSGEQMETFSIEEGNTGDAKVLQDFLKWGITNYPADRSIVILWGHGHGWRGCADDYSARDSLTMPELDKVLTNVTGNGKIELLGFDMCQMATLEVLFEVADECEYVIASQNVEPPDGWHYEELLGEPYLSPEKFGVSALRQFEEYYRAKNLDNYTLSLFKTAPVKGLAGLMEQLAEVSLKDESLYDEIQASRMKSLDFKYEKYVDIGAFVAALSIHTDNPKVTDLCKKINEVLNEIVIHKVAGKRYHSSRGLSIFFPEDLSSSDIEDYRHISFGQKHGGWNNLLLSLKQRQEIGH